MDVPADLHYTADHEWVRLVEGRACLGITDYAQEALGDIVFVQLPDVGHELVAGASFGEVESTKSVSDVYAPLSGTVVEVNGTLSAEPGQLNADPYGAGWLCVIEPLDPSAYDGLLDAAAYLHLIET